MRFSLNGKIPVITERNRMSTEKSRFLKRADGTVYDSLTSVTWMANDSRLDLDKELSFDEVEGYIKKTNEKNIYIYKNRSRRKQNAEKIRGIIFRPT